MQSATALNSDIYMMKYMGLLWNNCMYVRNKFCHPLVSKKYHDLNYVTVNSYTSL